MDWEAIGAVGELLSAAAVLATLIYLALQIRQSNNIALRDSRTDVVSAFTEITKTILGNPELVSLRIKLRDKDSELSDIEKEQALLLADHYFGFWSKVNVSVSTGLLPTANKKAYFEGTRNLIRTYPGLAPYIEECLLNSQIRHGDFPGIYDIIWQEIEKLKESASDT